MRADLARVGARVADMIGGAGTVQAKSMAARGASGPLRENRRKLFGLAVLRAQVRAEG